MLLSGLLTLLRPNKEEVQQHQITEGDTFVWLSVVLLKCCQLVPKTGV